MPDIPIPPEYACKCDLMGLHDGEHLADCPLKNSWAGVKPGDEYNQLVSCLRSNFKEAFLGTGYPDRDPQDMIQFMAAKIMEYRRRLGDYKP